MILTLSDDSLLCKKLQKIYFQNGYFSFFEKLQKIENFVDYDTDIIDFIVIDTTSDIRRASTVCKGLKERFPGARILALIRKKPSSKSLFITVEHADIELTFPFLDSDIVRAIEKFSSRLPSSLPLKIDADPNLTSLLGYRLKLTRTEHKILLLLYTNRFKPLSSSQIASLAFPCDKSPTGALSIAVHICNINKKATSISGRKLILNPHKNGYLLNFNM